MFSTLITVALFVSLAIQGTFAGFAINDPELNTCNPGEVSWSPGESPYTIEIVSASNPCGKPIVTLAGLSSTTYQYKTTLAVGTKILLYIADSGSNEAWSNEITIGGNSSACEPSPSSTTPPSIPQTSSTPSSSPTPGLGGAINAGSSSGGMLTVHRASTPLLFTALAALLVLTL